MPGPAVSLLLGILLISDPFDAGSLGGFVAEAMLWSLIIGERILALPMIYRLPHWKVVSPLQHFFPWSPTTSRFCDHFPRIHLPRLHILPLGLLVYEPPSSSIARRSILSATSIAFPNPNNKQNKQKSLIFTNTQPALLLLTSGWEHVLALYPSFVLLPSPLCPSKPTQSYTHCVLILQINSFLKKLSGLFPSLFVHVANSQSDSEAILKFTLILLAPQYSCPQNKTLFLSL